jgi:hypothetical protein
MGDRNGIGLAFKALPERACHLGLVFNDKDSQNV